VKGQRLETVAEFYDGQEPGVVRPRSWNTPSRPRVDKHELQGRFRWEVAS